MTKKSNYERPDQIVVDGEVVKFHYNKEERLKMSGIHTIPEGTGFFSAKFRYLHILIADIFIIAIIGIILLFFYGRSNDITVNDVLYKLSRKSFTSSGIVQFSITIYNSSDENRALPGNYIDLILKSETGEFIQTKQILLTKTLLHPHEQYMESLTFNGLEPDAYFVTLNISQNDKLLMNFRIKK